MSLACIAHFSCFRKCVDNVSRSFKVASYRKKTVLHSGTDMTTKLIPLRLPRVLRKSENGLWTITWISTSPINVDRGIEAPLASFFTCVDYLIDLCLRRSLRGARKTPIWLTMAWTGCQRLVCRLDFDG